ncbi:hypothetical protein D9613_008769 [Agrocybe pediades]|uniref:Uncharacterized protein n=1 Tax=Agrocybe pediades TaxID=84607 RepID=A0A8H4VN86_9AGAR|nr:hypothetical protein D9613_008769 [Agrocybe pediades]
MGLGTSQYPKPERMQVYENVATHRADDLGDYFTRIDDLLGDASVVRCSVNGERICSHAQINTSKLEVQHTELEPMTREILRKLKKLGYQLCHFRESKNEELTSLTRETPRRMKKVKWTRTHGFFLQMGGFMLREEGKKDRVLGWRTLMEYYRQGRLDLSEVTEDRINDHSKADWFAKGLALLQMFWFVTQCIARFLDKHLILTEIELATAALALLSLVMYFLWWNKPFNAGVPITITLLPAETDSQSKDGTNCRPESVADSINTLLLKVAEAVNPNVSHAQPVEATHPSAYSVDEAIPSVETNPHFRQSDPVNPSTSRPGSAEVINLNIASSHMLPALPPSPQSAHPRVQFVSGSQPTDDPPRSPTGIIESDKSSDGFQPWFLFARIHEILSDVETGSRDNPDDSAVTSVPSFYSLELDSAIAAGLTMVLTSFFAAALFGSVHCIGWSSKIVFTSHAASLAWRIASAVITGSPVVWCLAFIFRYVYEAEGCENGCASEDACYYLGETGFYVSVVTIPVYIVSRIVLLVVAFVELRHVPLGALDTIQWANVLPFIH